MCCSVPVVSSPVLNLAQDGNDDGSAADLNIFSQNFRCLDTFDGHAK